MKRYYTTNTTTVLLVVVMPGNFLKQERYYVIKIGQTTHSSGEEGPTFQAFNETVDKTSATCMRGGALLLLVD